MDKIINLWKENRNIEKCLKDKDSKLKKYKK